MLIDDNINRFHAGLTQVYDWVLRTDADELICVDPDRHDSLHDMLAAQDTPVVTALGFDVVEMPDDPALTDGPVLSQRRNIAFSGHYFKAVAARRAIGFALHGVRVAPRRLEQFPFVMPRGLFLAHLKFANGRALDDATQVRMALANGAEPGLPGAGWQQAEADRLQFLQGFAAKPERPWAQAEAAAFETLSVKPSRNTARNIVKARALKMPWRTCLPDRFSGLG